MIGKGISRALVLVAATGVIGASAFAVDLTAPSGVVSINGVNSLTLPSLTTGTLLDWKSSAFNTTAWSGTLYTTVVRETSGTLSFLYQIKVNPGTAPDHIARLTTIDFTGFKVDADYFTDSFTGFGFVAPSAVSPNPHTADRSTDNVIGFTFNNGISDPGLAKGEISSVFYIRTNAQYYTWGSSNLIDGKVASVDSFQPTVPGPAALVPFGVGLVSAFIRRRRK